MNLRGLNLASDIRLCIGVILLWSLGRVINPIWHAFERVPESPGLIFSSLMALYAAAHAVLLAYALGLMYRSLRKRGFKMHGRPLAEFLLYLYVCAALLLSLYFLAYQFGIMPPFLNGILPYPFTVAA